MDDTRYVKDKHGHIYIYVEHFDKLIGTELEFVEFSADKVPAVSEEDEFKWLGVFDNVGGHTGSLDRR